MKIFLLSIALLFILYSPVTAGEPEKDECVNEIGFRTVEVYVDSKNNPLAAYQVDIRYDEEKIKIIGLEGGSDGFDKPPFYDRAGLEGGRIIIAAFVENDSKAQKGRIRVARLHLQTKGCPPFGLNVKPMAAARPGGKEIPVTVEIDFAGIQEMDSREE